MNLIDADSKFGDPFSLTFYAASAVALGVGITIAATYQATRTSYKNYGRMPTKLEVELTATKMLLDVANEVSSWFNEGEGITIPEENKIPNSELNPPGKRGNAPTTKADNKPVEIHHVGQNPTGPYKEMGQKEHRGQGNDKRNHPNKNKETKIDRKKFNKQRRDYWKKEYDSGRFGDIR